METWKEKEKAKTEQRMEKLIGKKVSDFSVDNSCNITITFEDGTELSFSSWNNYDDRPGFEKVKVREKPKKKA